ncbi:hypothetical protein A8139_14905 [Marinomonas primoryensis]|uniref:Response regulator n=1 Tax=Marinomonas primoryensis TaxID=178399 RepID=A0A2Z4PUH8_9GAMM|nr:hypothetical protein [Marinomonas primoryensis]AWY01120.1 hypothetical protein A8139_14905 [Marinomonas primoryensis]
MASRSFSLNKQFKELLLRVEGTSIRRKELIQLASSTTDLDIVQSTRFVARNVSRLTSRGLLSASGERNARTYHLSQELLSMLNDSSGKQLNNEAIDTSQILTDSHLLDEEKKANAELRLLLGEIDAYQDYLEKFPQKRPAILKLLDESKEQATSFYGRLNAIKKIIKSAQLEGIA